MHPVDAYVGRRLRLRRSMLGISQETLAKDIGVTFQQIQKYEKGANRIGSSRLFDFSKSLKVDVGFFFEGYSPDGVVSGVNEAGEEYKSFSNDEVFGNKETITLVRSYYKIKDKELRMKIMSLIRKLANEKEITDIEA